MSFGAKGVSASAGEVQPDIQVAVSLDARKRPAPNQYEVTTKYKVTSKNKANGDTLFLLECDYVGIFHIDGVPEETAQLLTRKGHTVHRPDMPWGGGQMIAVFAVDAMRALLMRYGQRTADEVLWGFAKFLETMALPGHELAQLDGERFAVLLPEMTSRGAREWAEDVVTTFAGLAAPVSAKAPQLSASAGLARVECTVDWTLREAELGLVLARAGGGKQVAIAGHRRAA